MSYLKCLGANLRGPLLVNVVFENFIPGNPEHRRVFAELTREWLEEYNLLEPTDEEILADPEGYILAHDGSIIFANVERKPVGAGALFHREGNLYEMGKMTVTQSMRGKGIGRRIAEELISIARKKSIRTLYLGSNSNLHAALALYRSLGFADASMSYNAHYESCDVNMKMEL